jgi:hypothetical protein
VPGTGDASWLDFGKASQWTFDEDTATVRYEHVVLTYKIEKGE